VRVWLVSVGQPPPTDHGARRMRTQNVALELAKRGHAVTWWLSDFDHFKKRHLKVNSEQEEIDGPISLRYLRSIGYRTNASPRRYADDPLLAWQFWHHARTRQCGVRPDIVIAALPTHHLALAAVKFCLAELVPVIVDYRDPWPDLFPQLLPQWIRPVSPLLFAWDHRCARRCLGGATAILAATDTLLSRALGHAGRPVRRVDRVIFNAVTQATPTTDDEEKAERILAPARERLVVSFVGVLGRTHDPSALIAAARRVGDRDFFFVIAGDGERATALRKAAADCPHIVFPGWLTEGQMHALLGHSDVGVCPAGFETDVLPNKAQLYLSAGLPVLSSFSGDLQGILAKYDCGRAFKPGDDAALAQLLQEMGIPQVRERCQRNARKAFLDLFDARTVFPVYADYVEEIVRDRPAARRWDWQSSCPAACRGQERRGSTSRSRGLRSAPLDSPSRLGPA